MVKVKEKVLRIKQSPKLPAETRRNQILDAAHKCIDKKGYRATTIDDIAKVAGITKGAVYHHFKSKESILKFLVQCVLNGWIEAFEKIPVNSKSPGELLKIVKDVDHNMPLHKASHNLSIIFEIMQIPNIKKLVIKGYDNIVETFMKRLDPVYVKSKYHRKQLAISVLVFYDGICWATNFESKEVNFNKQAKLFSSLFIPGKENKIKKGKSQ